MITRRNVALLVVAFIIGLVIFLPARMLESSINNAVEPAQVSLRGTVWNGNGHLKSAALSLPVAWQFEPSALLRLRSGWRVETLSPQLSGAASIGAGVGSIEIRQTDLSFDIAMLPQLHRDLALVGLMGPSGRVAVSVADGFTAAYGSVPSVRGEALLKIDALVLASYSPRPLGNYQIKLTARDNILDYATGEFADQAEQQFADDDTRAALREVQASSRVEVRDLFVQSFDGDKGRVFAVVDQTIANNQFPNPRSDQVRLEIGMRKVDGDWKVSTLDVLEAPAAAAAIAGGTVPTGDTATTDTTAGG